MKINGIPPTDLLYQYVHVKEKQAPVYQANQMVDQVEITGDAKIFSQALAAARGQMEASNVNMNRIEEIKAQIANNTYFVPGVKVAEKMLGE